MFVLCQRFLRQSHAYTASNQVVAIFTLQECPGSRTWPQGKHADLVQWFLGNFYSGRATANPLPHTIGLKYIPNKTIVYYVTHSDVEISFYIVYHLFQQNYEYVSLIKLPHKLPVSKSFELNSVTLICFKKKIRDAAKRKACFPFTIFLLFCVTHSFFLITFSSDNLPTRVKKYLYFAVVL